MWRMRVSGRLYVLCVGLIVCRSCGMIEGEGRRYGPRVVSKTEFDHLYLLCNGCSLCVMEHNGREENWVSHLLWGI